MSITYTNSLLMSRAGLYAEMAKIGELALGEDPAVSAGAYLMRGYMGASVVLAHDEGRLIGSTIWGRTEAFVPWQKYPMEAIAIGNRGRMIGHSHLFVHPDYWGQGVHKGLVTARYREAFYRNYRQALIFDAHSDEMLDFMLALKGARVIEGITDSNGRAVCVIDLATFVNAEDLAS